MTEGRACYPLVGAALAGGDAPGGSELGGGGRVTTEDKILVLI